MAENSNNPTFVDLREACRRTGFSTWWLRRGCQDGVLPHIRVGRGKNSRYMLPLAELLQTLERMAVEGVATDG